VTQERLKPFAAEGCRFSHHYSSRIFLKESSFAHLLKSDPAKCIDTIIYSYSSKSYGLLPEHAYLLQSSYYNLSGASSEMNEKLLHGKLLLPHQILDLTAHGFLLPFLHHVLE